MKTRTTVRRKLTLELDIDLEVEFSSLFREATVVSAAIAETNIITPRMVHAAMKRGDYSELDSMAIDRILERFVDEVSEHQKKSPNRPPDKEIRSTPCHPSRWVKVMRSVLRQAPLPFDMLSKLCGQWGAFIEPVYGPKSCVYLWPVTPADMLINKSELMMIHLPSLNNPNMEPIDDGSIKLHWNY